MKLRSKIRRNKTRVKIPFLSVTGTLCGLSNNFDRFCLTGDHEAESPSHDVHV